MKIPWFVIFLIIIIIGIIVIYYLLNKNKPIIHELLADYDDEEDQTLNGIENKE